MAITNDPRAAIGGLFHGRPDRFLGSCFACVRPELFVTAAHCVDGVLAEECLVAVPRHGMYAVTRLRTHSSADLALVTVDVERALVPGEPVPEFFLAWNSENVGIATDFLAFGYPEDFTVGGVVAPTARLFKGHFQRGFEFKDRSYRYEAYEMSIPAPPGLSGGPVFCSPVYEPLGVVTGNFESIWTVDEHEETESEGRRTITKTKRVIAYGICLALGRLWPWLKEQATGSGV